MCVPDRKRRRHLVLTTCLGLLLRGAAAVGVLAAACLAAEAEDLVAARRATISAEDCMRRAASCEGAITRCGFVVLVLGAACACLCRAQSQRIS